MAQHVPVQQGDGVPSAPESTPASPPSMPSLSTQGSSSALAGVGGTVTTQSSGQSKTAAELSIEEQQIIAEIQELQRQLRELKQEQEEEPVEEEGEVHRRRILIVANRLPIRASRDGRTKRWVFEDAPGGLATALRGIAMDVEFVWVGWVGCEVPSSERERVTQRLMREHNCYPVYLDAELMEKFYNGFCNDVLWPLFHYVPLPMYQAGAEKKFDPSLWEAYKEANSRFAQAVCQVYDGSGEGLGLDDDRGTAEAAKSSAENDQAKTGGGPSASGKKKVADDSSKSPNEREDAASGTSKSGSTRRDAAPTSSASTATKSSTARDGVVSSTTTKPGSKTRDGTTSSGQKTTAQLGATGASGQKKAGGNKSTTTTRNAGKKTAASADLVWVHDYHLMRLPLELRRREPSMAVAWFLHTPFPSSEIYRILPFRRELLEGVLHADLVGFHTYDYARHFLSACSRVLDVVATTPKGIEFGGRFCSIGVFPIGIDPSHMQQALGSRAVDKRARELGSVFRGRKVLIGVDRLDYIKGMPHKLLAFELFLAKYPQWIGQVTLIQVGVPTRTEVEEYRSLAKHVNELVGRINGVYGSLEYAPIHYINQSIPQNELIAIYHIADACLVTSVRDGMNLVSHEYVAAQADLLLSSTAASSSNTNTHDLPGGTHGGSGSGDENDDPSSSRGGGGGGDDHRNTPENDDDDDDDDGSLARPRVRRLQKDGPGVLVLSEFAGSAQSLSGAIRVNPWNMDELADAIHTSLTLSRVERELRWNKLYRYVTTNTASYWARSFVAEFRDVCDHPPLLSNLPRLPTADLLRAYEAASHRLVVADYDGTLTHRQPLPQLATPAPAVTQLLAALAKDPKNVLYVMSGRERRYMDKWLGKYKVGLAAEFGFCHRAPDDPPGQWTCLGRDLDTSWKSVVEPIMQYFAERTPGTYIEYKESSLAWHFQDADPHFGAWQAKDMQIHMEDALANQPLEIIQGKQFVEVRHVGVNKSLVLEDVLRRGPLGRSRPAELAADDAARQADTTAQQADAASTASAVPEPPPPPTRSSSHPMLSDDAIDASEDFDFILCVGDDRSDEDMYQLLKNYYARRCEAAQLADPDSKNKRPPLALYLVRIGTGATQAEFYLDNIIDLRKILRGMASISLRDATVPISNGPSHIYHHHRGSRF